jgi:hypothetical protein
LINPKEKELFEEAISLAAKLAKEPLSEAEATYNDMEALKRMHPESQAIAHACLSALVVISTKQPLAEALKTVEHIENLSIEAPNDTAIASFRADALVRLCIKQDYDDCIATILKLYKLAEDHYGVIEFSRVCAQALGVLAMKQEPAKTLELVPEISRLFAVEPDIARHFHEGLLLMAQLCDRCTGLEMAVEVLKALNEKMSGIARIYAETLALLIGESPLDKGQKAAELLWDLTLSQPQETAVECAKGMFSLSLLGSEDHMTLCKDKTSELVKMFPENEIIANCHVRIIANSAEHLEGDELFSAVSETEQLYRKHPSDGAAEAYAYTLWRLFRVTEDSGSPEPASALMKLAENHKGNLYISQIYANCLFSSANKQDYANAFQTASALHELSASNIGSNEIALLYAKAVHNLIAKNDKDWDGLLNNLYSIVAAQINNTELLDIYKNLCSYLLDFKGYQLNRP